MNKIASKAAAGLAILLVVIALAAVFVLGRLDRIVKRAVETAGPEITGTRVALGGVHVSLFSGAGALEDLDIGNPAGFASENAFQLGEIAIEIEPRSVTQDVVRIHSLTVSRPRLTAEFDADGRDNLRTILDHVRDVANQTAGRPAEKSAGKSEAGGAQKRMIIERFRFVDAEVRAIAAPLKLDKTLKLPAIELKNLGARQGGASAAEIADQVMRPIVEATVKAARDEYLHAKGDEWKQKLKDKANNLLDSLRK